MSEGTLPGRKSDSYYTKCFEIIRSMLENGAEIGSGRRGHSESERSTSIDSVIEKIFSEKFLAKQTCSEGWCSESGYLKSANSRQKRANPRASGRLPYD
jgi:hypothetical protein